MVLAVVTMTYGKNGATCWPAGAVRTLQNRVEMLEAKQVLSNDDGLAASTVSWAIVRSKDVVGANAGLCVPRQKAVRELDFFDVYPPACNRVETVPFRHVSFAETVEMVEFDPAPAPLVEYDAALMKVHRAHAAPAPMVEYDAALMMAHRAHAAPAPLDEYDASAARAAPSP